METARSDFRVAYRWVRCQKPHRKQRRPPNVPPTIVTAAILARIIGRGDGASPRGGVFCFDDGIHAAIERGMVPSARLRMTRNMANLRRCALAAAGV